MRRTKRLRTLNRSLERRLETLSAVLAPHVGMTGPLAARAAGHVAIECVSSWALFAREYYLSCAMLSPTLRNGQRVIYPGPPITDERSALIIAIQATKNPGFSPGSSVKIKPRDEPDWLSKGTLSKISTHLSFSHDVRVTNALSIQASFFPHAISVRNFFAHRAKESADKVRGIAKQSYQSHKLAHPVGLINVVLPGRTDTLLNEWLAEVRLIARALCA